MNETGRVLRVGYPFPTYPFIHRTLLGAYRGISIDLWDAIATKIGAQLRVTHPEFVPFGAYSPDSSGFFGGLLQEIKDGRLDVAMSDYVCTPGRFSAFFCTFPFDNRVYRMYESARERPMSIYRQLQQFTIFPPVNLFLFSLGLLILQAAIRVQRIFHERSGIKASWTIYIVCGARLLSSLSVFFVYAALYTGNASLPQSLFSTTIWSVVNSLHFGNRSLITFDTDSLHPVEVKDFFGISNPSHDRFHSATLQKAADELCANHQNVYLDIEQDMSVQFRREQIQLKCQIRAIDNIDFLLLPKNATIVTSLDIGFARMKNHMYSRRMPEVTKYLNQVILRMYDVEKFSGLWFRRYTNRPQDAIEEIPSKFIFAPIKIHQFIIVLCCFSIGLVVGLCALICELEIIHRLAYLQLLLRKLLPP